MDLGPVLRVRERVPEGDGAGYVNFDEEARACAHLRAAGVPAPKAWVDAVSRLVKSA